MCAASGCLVRQISIFVSLSVVWCRHGCRHGCRLSRVSHTPPHVALAALVGVPIQL